ncbi:Mannose-1-phosphate guanylyltransferase/mannose-6-phosphate isomerase [Lentisphaera araneosa HTCC2155]|jgi:mannose-1-phosphate guanylyltransferase/mannose-6-phosphate isomerase|uniref:Mannose-1-phosphate guanylyltransferase/mannose-6-phosphate isomerase n=1 Tax=Lentisphaera araneosa HTCC2155 TaxID=313628 RepID=A6DJH9_9BACT|nr:cupin domain-containing protein [Lentisphaera araneosa]EDM28053.1 Mannose-1-phosphate guanylyltransferase/mannose-6-phosphate isomerase [Lentisphaera araneosa HTCC2155]
MFLARADVLLSELRKFRPAMHQNVCDSYELKHVEGSFIAPDTAAFENCSSESIDYAIMEQSKRIKMLALNTAWSDVGTWKELAKISETDEDGNSCIGDVLLQNSQNNYIRSNKKLCATVGVKDLIIVNNDDALLIAHKDESENVKQIVTQLEALKRPEARTHQTVNRPWGSYCNIDQDFGFKVKHITVKPGAKLSLQKHFHRAEHWVIVKGSALVTNGEENILLSENQSTYIPIGTLHRLENPGKIPLELIEVQSGNYLEEDDIVRYDDDYGRSNQSIPLKVNKDQKKGVS